MKNLRDLSVHLFSKCKKIQENYLFTKSILWMFKNMQFILGYYFYHAHNFFFSLMEMWSIDLYWKIIQQILKQGIQVFG